MYIKRLYREWRPAFWILLSMMASQVCFMYKGIENIPFFLYHMYSKKHLPQDSIAIQLLKSPYGYLDHHQFSNREAELLMNSAAYYAELQKKGDGTAEAVDTRFNNPITAGVYSYLCDKLINSDAKLAKYPDWWMSYFRSVTGNRYRQVQLVRSYVYASRPYRLSATDSLMINLINR